MHMCGNNSFDDKLTISFETNRFEFAVWCCPHQLSMALCLCQNEAATNAGVRVHVCECVRIHAFVRLCVCVVVNV